MLSFITGYPMLPKNNPIEFVVREIRRSAEKNPDLFSDGEFGFWLTIQEEKIENLALCMPAGSFEDEIFVYEHEYLEEKYLNNRKPRVYEGKVIGPRRDVVFKDKTAILEMLRKKFQVFSQSPRAIGILIKRN
jgi:hypothetical protein